MPQPDWAQLLHLSAAGPGSPAAVAAPQSCGGAGAASAPSPLRPAAPRPRSRSGRGIGPAGHSARCPRAQVPPDVTDGDARRRALPGSQLGGRRPAPDWVAPDAVPHCGLLGLGAWLAWGRHPLGAGGQRRQAGRGSGGADRGRGSDTSQSAACRAYRKSWGHAERLACLAVGPGTGPQTRRLPGRPAGRPGRSALGLLCPAWRAGSWRPRSDGRGVASTVETQLGLPQQSPRSGERALQTQRWVSA